MRIDAIISMTKATMTIEIKHKDNTEVFFKIYLN